ncbi:CaiB/BaiF CoA transferase family protein [Cytobacillus horneckiae]|uniref:CaiB/BaiF CoA transferase family protein n=1 Tax=Cytobacillus horneckiae TaxID=549687 RepID=UPI003D253DAE
MSRALEGVRIIDASRVLAGPFCTMILGDLGAEVIKIEHHQSGDETRGWGPPFVNGESAYYLCANRNKKSITLNLKSEEGKEIFKALAKDSDVVVQNFKTGTLEKMGLGYEELRRINEGIIVASITGFGNNGPYKDLPGYDYIIQAMSGLMSITGEKEGGPMKVGVAIADVLTALYTCIGILSAIHQRHATGEGQELDISLMDCQIASLINVASNYLVGGIEPSRLGNEHPNIAPYQVFSASDGDLVVAVGNDQQFKRFAQVAGMPELAEDSRFKENRLRVEHRAELIPICESLLKQRSKNEWKKILDDAGIPNGPINSISEMFNDPHVEAREMIMKVDHPLIEGLQLAGSPIKLSKSPVKVRQSPPLYGEHTGEILKEVGYSEEDIKNLKINQVI